MEPTPNQRLRIRRASPADGSAIANIKSEAFGPGVMYKLMHPDGGSETARTNFAKKYFPSPEHTVDPSVEIIVMVAELLSGQERRDPEIVAFAKWRLVKEPLPKEKWDVDYKITDEEIGEGSNIAGVALLAWGTGLADMEGKTTWLEASPVGYALYKKFGFEDVDVQDLNVTEMWSSVQGQHEDWGATSAVTLAGDLPKGHFRTDALAGTVKDRL
ncbi:hypothetical protein VMCG_07733 [Cytospora schulzeri]|uniref:N-acetyltransferase domain-containing protein n=1 Tax=Cytospora schulzeri TaxID=448051 RepID=A0A423VZ32_9PEZI|nr:hypothetical protein VMCG_07733 [Valsa malicola]